VLTEIRRAPARRIGEDLVARGAPVECSVGMCRINIPPTRGFSVNRFHDLARPNVTQQNAYIWYDFVGDLNSLASGLEEDSDDAVTQKRRAALVESLDGIAARLR